MRVSSSSRRLTSLSRFRSLGIATLSVCHLAEPAFLSSSFILSRKQSTLHHHWPHHDTLRMQGESNQTTQEVARINFSRAQPPSSLIPFSLLQSAVTTQSWTPVDDSFLGYGDRRGQKDLLEVLASFISSFTKTKVSPESLFITNGASLGLDMLLEAFASPGDTIFVEDPTYFYAIDILRDHKVKMVGVSTDHDGLLTDELEAKLKEYYKTNTKPPLAYIIPTFNNPTGKTLSHERRLKLVELSEKYSLKVIADEVYQFLEFPNSSRTQSTLPPPLFTYTYGRSPALADNIIGMNSFSKIIAPGLRLGWIQGSEAVLHAIEKLGVLRSGGGLNPFTSNTVAQLMRMEGGKLYRDHLSFISSSYSRLNDKLCSCLERHFPGASSGSPDSLITFDKAEGGFFLWVKFNEKRIPDARLLLKVCNSKKVAFKPGYLFSCDGSLFHNYGRFSFAYYTEEEIEDGVARFADAVHTFVKDNHFKAANL